MSWSKSLFKLRNWRFQLLSWNGVHFL